MNKRPKRRSIVGWAVQVDRLERDRHTWLANLADPERDCPILRRLLSRTEKMLAEARAGYEAARMAALAGGRHYPADPADIWPEGSRARNKVYDA